MNCKAMNLQGEGGYKMLKFNLQLFAEEEDQLEVIQLTQAELDAKLQIETDRKVTKALETAKAKWESEYSERVKLERQEAEELAKLSEKERAEKERQKEREQFEDERKTFKRERLELQTTKILTERNLPMDFVPFVLAEDDQATLDKINKMEELWNKAIESAVDARLKGKTPRSGGTPAHEINPFDKATFNLSEQGRLYKENPNEAVRLKKIAK